MAWALVGAPVTVASGTDDFSDASIAVTVPATTIGNTLVLVIQCGRSDRTGSVSGGGTWGAALHRSTSDVGGTEAPGCVEIHAAVCTSSVTTITASTNANSGGSNDRVTFFEFSGGADPRAESGASTGSVNASGNNHNAAAITPDTADTLFVGAVLVSGNPGAWTLDAEFTAAFTLGTLTHAVGYRIQNGDATAQAFDNSTSTARLSVVAFAALQGAAGAGGSSMLLRLQGGLCNSLGNM